MEILENLRDAGMVKRMHTIPTVRQNTVGQHVYGSLIIARDLVERSGVPLTAALMEHVLFHDAAELEVGDIPAPTKRMIAQFNVVRDLEIVFETTHGIDKGCLTEKEITICKAADIIDLGFFCLSERRFGNLHWRIDRMLENVFLYLEKYADLPGVTDYTQYLRKEFADASR